MKIFKSKETTQRYWKQLKKRIKAAYKKIISDAEKNIKKDPKTIWSFVNSKKKIPPEFQVQ